MNARTREDILIESLPANKSSLGTVVVRTIYLAALAERAVDLVDLERGRLRADWDKLDDQRYRSKIITWDSTLWQACVTMLKPNLKAVNSLLAAGGQTKLSDWPAMEPKLTNAMPIVVRKAMKLIET